MEILFTIVLVLCIPIVLLLTAGTLSFLVEERSRGQNHSDLFPIFLCITIGWVLIIVSNGYLIDTHWKKDAVKHSAAEYVTKDGEPLWKWKHEPEKE